MVPAQVGAPLVAWDGLTLAQLWKLQLPPDSNSDVERRSKDGKFEGVVGVLCEYLELCIDWERVVIPATATTEGGDAGTETTESKRKTAVRNAVTLLVAAAVRTSGSKEVKKEVDEDRCGIAMWRIP